MLVAYNAICRLVVRRLQGSWKFSRIYFSYDCIGFWATIIYSMSGLKFQSNLRLAFENHMQSQKSYAKKLGSVRSQNNNVIFPSNHKLRRKVLDPGSIQKIWTANCFWEVVSSYWQNSFGQTIYNAIIAKKKEFEIECREGIAVYKFQDPGGALILPSENWYIAYYFEVS